MARFVGIRPWIILYLKGACMGAADTVPGVSGGTLAVILGIYERLITALTSLDPTVIRYLSRFHRPAARADFTRALYRMDVPFLGVLGLGVLSAAATVASAMHIAVVEYPAPTYSFFFGLIGASAIVLYRYIDVTTPDRLIVGVAGFLLAVLVTDPSLQSALPTTPTILFVAGAIAISAMVLPGVSGSFLLLVLGQYTFISGLPRMIAAGIIDAFNGDSTTLVAALTPFAAFLAGALVGVFSIAYAVRLALDRYRHATLTFLVSLMVGALRLPLTEIITNRTTTPSATIGVVFIPLAVGGVVVFLLDAYTEDLEY